MSRAPGEPITRVLSPAGGECPFCGYPLKGLDDLTFRRCPECGEPIVAGSYDRARPRRLERAAVAGLFVSGFVLSASGVLSVVGIPMILLGIAVLGTPGGVGPKYRRFLLVAAVLSWVILPGALIVLLFLLRSGGLLP